MSGEVPTSASVKVVRFTDVVRAVRRGALPAMLVALIAGAAAFLYSTRQQPMYSAGVSLVAVQPRNTFGNLELATPPQVDPRVFQSALLDGPVLPDAIARVDGSVPSEQDLRAFKRRVRVTVENQLVSGLVKIEVRDASPQRAALYADTIANILVEWDRERARQAIDSSVNALELAIADLDSQIAAAAQSEDQANAQRVQVQLATIREQRVRELEVARARGTTAVAVSSIQVLSPAAVPERAVAPRVLFTTFIAVVLGLIVGYAFQLVRWSLRDEVGNGEKLSDLTDLPILASFPRAGRRLRANSDAGSFFRANLLAVSGGAYPLTVGITSPDNFADKVGVAGSLAERLSASGHRVLLVDGDLRRLGPGLGMSPARTQVPGLEAYLQQPTRQVQPLLVGVGQQASFDFIPSNAPTRHSSELVEYGMRPFLDGISGKYDVVIFDLPPTLSIPDAITAASACTGLVLCVGVAEKGQAVKQAMAMLETAGGRLLGTVLTGVRGVRSDLEANKAGMVADRSGRGSSTAAAAPAREDSRPVVRVKQRG